MMSNSILRKPFTAQKFRRMARLAAQIVKIYSMLLHSLFSFLSGCLYWFVILQSPGESRLVSFFVVSGMVPSDWGIFISAKDTNSVSVKYNTTVCHVNQCVSNTVNLIMTLTLAGDPSKSKTAHTFYLSCLCTCIVPHLVLDAFGVNPHHREWPDWERTVDIL